MRWDVASGRTIDRWTLPEGLFDLAAYPARDELILARVESRDGQVIPYGNVDVANPNVFRVRDMLAPWRSPRPGTYRGLRSEYRSRLDLA